VRVLAVVGPTAAGKSDLAVALGARSGGEVVNADSMQLYRGMDVGTAKLPLAGARGRAAPPARRLAGHPHRRPRRLPGAVPARTVDELLVRGVLPVLVGGSGLYLRAALDDLVFPGTDLVLRASLEAELAATALPCAAPAARRRSDPGRRLTGWSLQRAGGSSGRWRW
jgi:tRNA dimethylallyltransferase